MIRQRRRWIAFAMILSGAGVFLSHALVYAAPAVKTKVIVHQESSFPGLSPEILEVVAQEKFIPFDYSEMSPEMRAFLPRLEKFIARHVLPKDTAPKIHVLLVDHMGFDALYSPLPNGESLVLVSVGVLSKVRTDDELSAILSHEMSHATSPSTSKRVQFYDEAAKLQDEAKVLREQEKKLKAAAKVKEAKAAAEKADAKSAEAQIKIKAAEKFERMSEVEADLQGAIERMIAAGTNPHGMIHMTDHLGSGISKTHPFSTTRKDYVSMAITAASRMAGKPIPQDNNANYSYGLVLPLQRQYLHTDRFAADQKKKAEAYLHNFRDRADEVMRLVRTEPERIYELKKWFSEDVEKAQRGVRELVEGLLSEEELVEFQLRLRGELEKRYYEAEERAFKSDPRELKILRIRLELMDRGADPFVRELIHRRSEKKYHEQYASRFKAEDIQRVNNQYLIYRNAFVSSGDGSDIDQMADAEDRMGLLRRLRYAGDWLTKRDDRSKQWLIANQQNIIDAVLDPKTRNEAQSLWYRLPEGLKAAAEVKLAEGSIKQLLTGSKTIDSADAVRRYLHSNPGEGLPLFRRALEHHLKNLPLEPYSGILFVHPGSVSAFGFSLNEDWTKNIFANGLADLYLKKRIAISDQVKEPKEYRSILKAIVEEIREFQNRGLADAARREELVKTAVSRMKSWAGFSEGEASAYLAAVTPELYKFAPESFPPAAKMRADLVRALKKLPYELGVLEVDPFVAREVFFGGKQDPVRFAFLRAIHLRVYWRKQYFSREYEKVSELLAYARWLEQNHPDEFTIRRDILKATYDESNSVAKELYAEQKKLFDGRYRANFEKSKSTTLRPRVKEALRGLIADFGEGGWGQPSAWGIVTALDFAPSDPSERIQFINGFLDASGSSAAEAWKVAWPIYKQPGLHAQVELHSLVDTYIRFLKLGGTPNLEMEEAFELVWQLTEKNAAARALFSDPEIVEKLQYDQNRLRLAKWQLEQQFKVSEIAAKLKNPKSVLPAENKVWPEVLEAKRMIDRQFPKPGGPKDEVLRWIEDSWLTNSAESRLLSKGKQGVSNASEGHGGYVIDAPRVLFDNINSLDKRILMMRFLLNEPEPPEGWGFESPIQERLASSAKRHFQEADIYRRTFAVMGMVGDGKSGIWAIPEKRAELFKMAMGSSYDDEILRELFLTYLDSVPESEARTIVSNLLASSATQSKKGASIQAVFDAMGPFGVKAAQFLRTSGLAKKLMGEEAAKALDVYKDQALKPDRKYLIEERIKKVFLKGTKVQVRQVLGAGSINISVLVDVQAPGGDQWHQVALRLQREAVEGTIANENAIWQRVIAKLAKSENSALRSTAPLLEEARSYSMRMLGPGGQELDLSYERAQEGPAVASYESQGESPIGIKIRVVKVNQETQKLIRPEFSREASTYEFIQGVSIDRIQDLTSKKAVHSRVVAAELHALFQLGAYDPDGHSGNWLYEAAGEQLFRLDYAQFTRLTREETTALREVIGALIKPRLSNGDVTVLARLFPQFFEITGHSGDLSPAIQEVLTDPAFPEASEPHQRVWFIPERLEQALKRLHPDAKVRIRPAMRNAVMGLSRLVSYREDLGDLEMGRIILKALNVSVAEYGKSWVENVIAEKTKEPLRSVRCLMEGLRGILIP